MVAIVAVSDVEDIVPPVKELSGPELFFALVYPVGTDSEAVAEALTSALESVGYGVTTLHLIEELEQGAPDQDEHDRYTARMDAGNDYCRTLGRGDALALLAAALVARDRDKRYPEGNYQWFERATQREGYILRSLKRPQEVEALRDIYGNALVVVAAHSSPKARRERLTWRIARSEKRGGPPDQFRPEAEELIVRDHRELDDEYGQRVSDTFPLADVFVDATNTAKLKGSVNRFIELLFGNQFHTPSRDEYGMFHAAGAALRSADLSRQVGAAIANDDGELIALGTNEVPRGNGGLYWEGDEDDSRDFTQASDISTEIKRSAVSQILDRLDGMGLLTAGSREKTDEVWDRLQGTDLLNVGEFGRSVHAEMAALVDAARRGIAVRGCTLYTTTFPCHVCARHLVAAGIRRVVYNEPYPKSLARYLHLDALAIEEEAGPDQVACTPFVGVSPKLYVDLFRAVERRNPDGSIARWNRSIAEPRVAGIPIEYLRKEAGAVITLKKQEGG